jgi:hypothetical protein
LRACAGPAAAETVLCANAASDVTREAEVAFSDETRSAGMVRAIEARFADFTIWARPLPQFRSDGTVPSGRERL